MKSVRFFLVGLSIVFHVGSIFSQCTGGGCGADLIYNGNFNIPTANCNGSQSEVYSDSSPIDGWFGTDLQASATSSPDYFAQCSGNLTSTPCVSITSPAVVGVFVHGPGNNVREYLQAKLTAPLVAGKTYCFSMQVWARTNANGSRIYGTDGMGVWVHDQGLKTIAMNGGEQFMGPGSVVNGAPQIQQPLGTLIDETCQTLEGQICASGGEEWIMIGNFRDDGVTLQPEAIGYLRFTNVEIKESCSSDLGANLTVTKDSICPGECSDVQVVYNGAAPTGVTYEWSDGTAGQDNITICTGDNVMDSVIISLTTTCGVIKDTLRTNVFAKSCATDVQVNDTAICEGSCAYLHSTLNNIDPIGATYLWTPSGATTPTITVCPGVTQEYELRVTDSGGNVYKDTSGVTVTPSPVANAGVDADLCKDDKVLLQGSGGGAYQWLNSGPALSDYEVEPTTTTTYFLEVTQNGCSDTDTVLVNVFDLPVVSGVGIDVSCFGNADGSIQTTVVGGTPMYSYQWSPNTAATANVTGLSAQEYTVTVTDSKGCVGSQKITINEPVAVDVSLNADNSSYCEGADVSLSASAAGGVNPYVYSWSHSSDIVSDVITSADASMTEYEVYVEDQLGCKDTAKIAVNVIDKPTADFEGGETGCPELEVTYTNKSLGSDTYYWSLGDANASSDEHPSVTYIVGGCKDVTLIATAGVSGCADTLTKTCVTNVYPEPVAIIKTNAVKVDEYEPEVTFTNNSIDAVNCYTAFGDGEEFLGCSPKKYSHSYTGVGEFIVVHAVANSFGCVDTAFVKIEVEAASSLFVPNTFMPNVEGVNQVFYVYGYGVAGFELQIFDRWGKLVFEADDISKGWDGKYKEVPAPQDAYVWKVKYTDTKNIVHRKIGHVNLLR